MVYAVNQRTDLTFKNKHLIILRTIAGVNYHQSLGSDRPSHCVPRVRARGASACAAREGRHPWHPPHRSSSPQKDCGINEREAIVPATRDRRSGDEAFERKLSNYQLRAPNCLNRLHLGERRLPIPVNDPHSKAEEPDCLSCVSLPFIMITPQSQRGEEIREHAL